MVFRSNVRPPPQARPFRSDRGFPRKHEQQAFVDASPSSPADPVLFAKPSCLQPGPDLPIRRSRRLRAAVGQEPSGEKEPKEAVAHMPLPYRRSRTRRKGKGQHDRCPKFPHRALIEEAPLPASLNVRKPIPLSSHRPDTYAKQAEEADQ